jgi:hypothetical protein
MRIRFVFASVLIVVPAFGQTLTEHGAALAGATIGSAAGKSVSNGITKIFGALDASAGKAAEDKDKTKPPSPPVVTASPQSLPVAAASAGPVSSPPRASASRRVSNRTESATSAVAMYNLSPAIEPTLANLQSIKAGTPGDTLAKTLGEPSSTITIPEDGHLVQVLRYRAQGQLLGVIHLDNGEVVKVDAVAAVSN